MAPLDCRRLYPHCDSPRRFGTLRRVDPDVARTVSRRAVTEKQFEPDATLVRVYPEAAVGGYSSVDGSIEFYTRVNALIDAESRVLDFGAGRGWWSVEPVAAMYRSLRLLRGRVAEVVGADVDPVVTTNPSVDRAVVLEQGDPLPFGDATFDLVIADYVLEHVDAADAQAVADEFIRVLKPGGWLAARTPNKWGLIGVGARAVPNRLHTRFLARLQPDRQVEDVFPVRYAMNTKRVLARLFPPITRWPTATPANRPTSAGLMSSGASSTFSAA